MITQIRVEFQAGPETLRRNFEGTYLTYKFVKIDDMRYIIACYN